MSWQSSHLSSSKKTVVFSYVQESFFIWDSFSLCENHYNLKGGPVAKLLPPFI